MAVQALGKRYVGSTIQNSMKTTEQRITANIFPRAFQRMCEAVAPLETWSVEINSIHLHVVPCQGQRHYWRTHFWSNSGCPWMILITGGDATTWRRNARKQNTEKHGPKDFEAKRCRQQSNSIQLCVSNEPFTLDSHLKWCAAATVIERAGNVVLCLCSPTRSCRFWQNLREPYYRWYHFRLGSFDHERIIRLRWEKTT